MRPSSLLLPVAAAAAALLFVYPARAQSLRYGGEEGRRDRYRQTNTVQIHQEFQGASTDLTVRSYGVLDFVLTRAQHDTLTYAVTFDSLDLTFEGAPVPAPDLSCVVGRSMTLKLSPLGSVHGFEVGADMCQTPPGFDLKQMVSNFFPRLVDSKVEVGTAWSDTLDYPVSQQGIESQVRVVTSYTSRGEAPDSTGSFVLIDYGTATTVSGKGEQAGTPLFLDGAGKGTGTILFDAGARTFWSSKGSQTLDLKVDVTPDGQPPMSIPVRQQITAQVQHL